MVHSNNADKKNKAFSKTFSLCVALLTALMLFSKANADDYTQWKYWTKVTINTTVITGLNGSVTNFPLLVRLTSSNFDFTKAKTGGADIRFSNSANTHLSYEIERWDGTNRLADIWVLVDNIANSNNTQYIKMYWGNAAAADSTKPADVFKTANNFAAVWHLNEDPTGAVSGAIKDRTSNGNHGTSGGSMTAADLVDGMIGRGIDFNGGTDTNDYINVGSGSSLDNKEITTVSAWIYPQGWGGLNYGRILNKTDNINEGLIFMVSNYGNSSLPGGVSTFVLTHHRSTDTSDARGADSTVRLNQWNHITGVMNGTTSIRLYINGSEVSGYLKQKIGSGSVSDESGYTMYIGNRQNPTTGTYDRGFNGIMDEITMSNNVRSANWIKLCYETQKSNQIVDSVKQTTMPSFTTNPLSATVYQTQPASFTVAVNGTPAPTIQWQKKQGTGAWGDISGATGTTYSIASAAFSDSGSYQAIATNINGSATSSEANLIVLSGTPAFAIHPQSDSAKVTQSAFFIASTTGYPKPTCQWQKKQGTGAWNTITGATDTFYTISSVILTDSGSYQVIATNTNGQATSNPASLFVYDTFSIRLHPVNDTAAVGGTADFSVSATGATTKYQWQKMVGTGGTPAVITGATSAAYSFTVLVGDTGTYYRCVVSSGPESLNSNFGMLVVGSAPNVPANQFSSDTVLAVGKSLTLNGTATGSPTPALAWFFKHPAGSPVQKGTGNTLQLNSLAKTDSGSFYFVASNSFGTKNSDSLFTHVLTRVAITTDLPPSLNAVHGGSANFGITVSGDGQKSYQWYRNSAVIPGALAASYTLSPVDSAIHNGNTFFCITSNRHSGFPGMIVGSDTSVVCTLKISNLYNPFKVKVERVDIHNTTQVRMKLWSDVNISTFPSTLNPVLPWADSVWVMYKTKGYATNPGEAKTVKFSINTIKSSAPDSLKSIVTVGALPMPADSFYWFNYAVLWHVPSKPDTLLKPYISSDKVFMLDTGASPNPLIIHGEYIMKTETALLIIDNINGLSSVLDSIAVIQCSKFSDFSNLILNQSPPVSQLIASGNKDTIIMTNLGVLPLEKYTVYCRWYVIAKNTSQSRVLDTTFAVGWDRPVYTGTLTALNAGPLASDRIHVSWTAPQSGTDSVRIWRNTSPIPLVHNPSLPVTLAFYPSPQTATIDTVEGLNDNTLYYFGLQIKKDDFWSVITAQSSASAKTSPGDTTIPPNRIRIDSTRFDPSRNSMVLNWHINLASMPVGQTYQSGVTYTLEPSIDITVKPVVFVPISQNYNSTEVILYPDITFDTTYTVGLWVRGVGGPLGTTPASKPVDTSTARIAIPSFTWQEVNFFPDSNVEFAANRKIILKQIPDTNFIYKDTVRVYNPGTLPSGFVDVGGVCFKFSAPSSSPLVKTFLLGLKYGTLPVGINESDIGFYQLKNGQMYVSHGFTISENTVWAKVKAADLLHPFIILADMLKPTVLLKEYNDTVPTGTTVPSYFTVMDNIANTYWNFKYGRGDTVYTYSKEGYLNKSNDTGTITEFINTGAISQYYGVRAIVVASDGVHNDTLNVSKCVRNPGGETFGIPPKKWVPLRMAGGLENRSLDQIFDGSVPEPDPWKYNSYKCRLYRWYTANTSGPNSWLEYADAVKSVFEFTPGKLVWCQMADSQTIQFGRYVTTSLKKPYEIVLKPKDWTDISTPFQFPIRLKDVLLATAPSYDSLVVCRWVRDNNSYTGEYLFIYSKDDIDTISSIIRSGQLEDGYTVYNHYSYPVTLKIPPICLALSSQNSEAVSLAGKKMADQWEVNLKWREAGAAEGYFKRVICCYDKSKGRDFYGPLPPTMSKIKVGVFDNVKNRANGWALRTAMDKNGGVAYEISFDNNSANDTKIEYYLESAGGLPAGIKARLYNAKGNGYVECTKESVSSLDLNANGSIVRIIAVGPDSYFDHIAGGFMPVKVVKTFPNPFRGTVRIQYRIPFGIKEVAFTVYSIQGKVLWHGTDRINVDAGEHAYTIGLGKDIVPAGVYIIRLSAKDVFGNTIYGGEKRITCIK